MTELSQTYTPWDRSETIYESSITHRPCPRGCMGNIQIVTTVGQGRTVISKICAVCGQPIGLTTLPVEQWRRLKNDT